MSPFGNVWARYSRLFPPTFALPQKVPVREAFLAISSISVPITDSTTLWAKSVPMRCRAPWPNVIRRPSFLCRQQSQHANRGSDSHGAERRAQHPGSHRQGHGQGREDNSKAGVQQSPAQQGNGERQRYADLWKQADKRSTFAAAPPLATHQGRASGRARQPTAGGDGYLRDTEPAPASS